MVRDAVQLVHELGLLCNVSGKFKALFSSIAAGANESPVKNLKPLCPTRWLVRIPAVQAALLQYDNILDALQEAPDICSSEVSITASGLLR